MGDYYNGRLTNLHLGKKNPYHSNETYNNSINLTVMNKLINTRVTGLYHTEVMIQNLPSRMVIPLADVKKGMSYIADVTTGARKDLKTPAAPWFNQSIQESLGEYNMMFLDVDSDKLLYDHTIVEICNEVQEFLQYYTGIEYNLEEPYVSDAVSFKHLRGKGWIAIRNIKENCSKYHIYFPGYVFSKLEIKAVFKNLNTNVNSLIDPTNGLRLPHQFKANGCNLSVYKITNDVTHDLLHYHITKHKTEYTKPLYDIVPPAKVYNTTEDINKACIINRWNIIASKHPEFIISPTQNDAYTCISLNRIAPSTCPNSNGTIHTSNGATFSGRFINCYACGKGYKVFHGEGGLEDSNDDDEEYVKPKRMVKYQEEEEVEDIDYKYNDIIFNRDVKEGFENTFNRLMKVWLPQEDDMKIFKYKMKRMVSGKEWKNPLAVSLNDRNDKFGITSLVKYIYTKIFSGDYDSEKYIITYGDEDCIRCEFFDADPYGSIFGIKPGNKDIYHNIYDLFPNSNGMFALLYKWCVGNEAKDIINESSTKMVMVDKEREFTKEDAIEEFMVAVKEKAEEDYNFGLYGDLKIQNNQYVDLSDYHTNDTLIINSDLGTGKTHNLLKVIEEGKLPKNVLFISTRILQVIDTCAKFKFGGFFLESYADCDLSKANRVCTTVESLHKMDYTKEWDLVIMDEATSIISQLSSPHHRYGRKSFKVLRDICTSTKKLVMLDGNIDERSLIWKRMTRTGRSCVVIDNKFSKSKPTIVYEDKGRMVREIYDLLECGNTITLASATVKEIDEVSSYLLAKGLDVPTKIYSTKHEYDKKDLLNVDSSWETTQFVCYSPTISQGISYTKPVDHVFLFTNGNSVTYRESFQMACRSRDVGVYHIYAPGGRKMGKTITRSDITKEYVNVSIDDDAALIRLIKSGVVCSENIESKAETNSHEFRLFCLNELETRNNKSNHSFNVYAHMERCGFHIDSINIEKNKRNKELVEAVKEQRKIIKDNRQIKYSEGDISKVKDFNPVTIDRLLTTGHITSDIASKVSLSKKVDEKVFEDHQLTDDCRKHGASIIAKLETSEMPEMKLLEKAVKELKTKRKKVDRYHSRCYMASKIIHLFENTLIPEEDRPNRGREILNMDGKNIQKAAYRTIVQALIDIEDKTPMSFDNCFDVSDKSRRTVKLSTILHKYDDTKLSDKKQSNYGLEWYLRKTVGSFYDMNFILDDNGNLNCSWMYGGDNKNSMAVVLSHFPNKNVKVIPETIE